MKGYSQLFYFFYQRRPPLYTLFPYTTLFRSLGAWLLDGAELLLVAGGNTLDPLDPVGLALPRIGRSEEHTSELQSQSNLVCRLLLEKKNNNESIHRSKAR